MQVYCSTSKIGDIFSLTTTKRVLRMPQCTQVQALSYGTPPLAAEYLAEHKN
jgi:hypothetical protein